MTWRRLLAVWAFVAFAAWAWAHPGGVRAAPSAALRAQRLIAGLDLESARGVLASADPDDPNVSLERARLAIDEMDCDGAAIILSRPDVEKVDVEGVLGEIARGCQRVTAALAMDKDDALGIEIRWQDENDVPLRPLLIETIQKARAVLSRELGVDWPRPTRVVVVRDLLSLSAMTGLPYESARTTGTVAVAKWGRITLLSPRASAHGYAWRDTIAHELTHLAVTRASGDRAPLWLQEGIAKREEIRWREPGPFDGRPHPDAIASRGTELGLGLPLDKLGPSIAMLPSADAAMVAFAEVTSFVAFYAQTQGADALVRLLAELRSGKEPDEALSSASGADLKGWDGRWRAYLATRPRVEVPGLHRPATSRHNDGRDLKTGDDHGSDKGGHDDRGGDGEGASEHQRQGGQGETAALRRIREASRLAELLLARGHASQASTQIETLDRIDAPGDVREQAAHDPTLHYLRARVLEALGRAEDSRALVSDPHTVASSYAPWWAIRGRWARLGGDVATATGSYIEAVAADPFDVESACETLDTTPPSGGASDNPLCDAARAWGKPSLGGD